MSKRIAIGVMALLVGCTEQLSDTYAPEFEGSGRARPALDYAAGPYGFEVGSTIADLGFVGFPNPDIAAEDDDVREMRLSDFYNPLGIEVFAENSPYGAQPKPTALLIDLCTVWCGPCNTQASGIFVEKRALYRPLGGEIFLALSQGDVGDPATIEDLREWTEQYPIDWPSAIDPTETMFQYATQAAYPNITLVRTKDMKIIAKHVGGLFGTSPEVAAFWDTFEAILADEPVLPEDE